MRISSSPPSPPDIATTRQLQKLQQTDREVRQHEQAHVSAGGSLVSGGASFSYKTGSDGKQYAVGGEVSIDTSPVRGNPKATILKAHQIRSAALAPANPSSQDRKVAAQATRMAEQAQRQIAIQHIKPGENLDIEI